MLILIDGPICIGKTTIGQELANKISQYGIDSSYMDSDDYYHQFKDMMKGKAGSCNSPQEGFEYIRMAACGMEPFNNPLFAKYLQEKICKHIDDGKTVIASMSLASDYCKKIINDYFSKERKYLHIILKCSQKELDERIENSNRTAEAIKFAKTNNAKIMPYLEKNYEDGYWITVDNKTSEDVVEEILTIFRALI